MKPADLCIENPGVEFCWFHKKPADLACVFACVYCDEHVCWFHFKPADLACVYWHVCIVMSIAADLRFGFESVFGHGNAQ